MLKLRLKLIEQASFTRSEVTNYGLLKRKLEGINLGPNGVVCLVSRDNRQLVFMWQPRHVNFSHYGRRQPHEKHEVKTS